MVVAVLALGLAAVGIAVAVEITKLKSEIASMGLASLGQVMTLQQTFNTASNQLDNTTEHYEVVLLDLQQTLVTVSERVDNVTETSIEMHRLIMSSNNMYQQISNDISALYLALERHSQAFPASSCADIPLTSPSGYYWVRSLNGSAVRVYCDMTRSCGEVTGGWMRVAQIDMTNSSQQCPSDFKQRTDFGIRSCVRTSDVLGCSLLSLASFNINYMAVCGRVIAYQINGPDAFLSSSAGIDYYYVDGVSVTRGSIRQHLWTFAVARDEIESQGFLSSCPCINGSGQTNPRIPYFVGDNYFCDTGSRALQQNIFYHADPLWDGAGCGPRNTCCSFNNPPWFYRQLSQPTADDIETRVCRSNSFLSEDIGIEILDLYVR